MLEIWRHSCWSLSWPTTAIKLSREGGTGDELQREKRVPSGVPPEQVSQKPFHFPLGGSMPTFSLSSLTKHPTQNIWSPAWTRWCEQTPHWFHPSCTLPLSSYFGVIISRDDARGSKCPAGTVCSGAFLWAGCWKNPIWLETGLNFSWDWSWENTYETPPCQPEGAILLITSSVEAKLTQSLYLAGALVSSVPEWTNLPFSLLHEPLAAIQSVWWQLCTPRKIDFRPHREIALEGSAAQSPAPVGGGFDYMHSGKQNWPSPTPSLFSYAFLFGPGCAPLWRIMCGWFYVHYERGRKVMGERWTNGLLQVDVK